MEIEEARASVRRSTPHIKVASALWLTALMIIMGVSGVWIALAVMTGDYLSSSKAIRDAASAGSGLLSQHGAIETLKLWVLPFAFLGLAMFLLGFGIAFADILRNVRLRGATMAAALPLIKERMRVE